MRITSQLLRSRAEVPLHLVEYLDLSNADIDCVEKLNCCPKLKTLSLRGNHINYVSNLECCQQLWKIDLGCNKIKNLDGFSRFLAIGTLVLCNNHLSWSELAKIRHMHILNLSLHGNPQLEKDPYYRIHVIDSLPHVWMLDGRIITSAERVQVQHFFQDSALGDHPVRHKLSKDKFTPTCLKKIEVNGVFGERSTHLMRHFPVNCALNVALDTRRLQYLAHTFQEDLAIEAKYLKRDIKLVKSEKTAVEGLIEARSLDRERCNMLLLLLVASLEFAMPAQLVKDTLEVTKLDKIGKVATMDVFMLPRDIRCSVVSILLSAVKVDKDMGENGGLYDKLYLGLYYSVSELTKLCYIDSMNQQSGKQTQPLYKSTKCLIASEVVQLLCIVPAFFTYLNKDVGVMNLVCIATSDMLIIDKLTKLTRRLEREGSDVRTLYERLADHIIQAIQQNAVNVINKPTKSQDENFILNTSKAIPKRPQSTPIFSSEYHASGRHSPDRKPTCVSSGRQSEMRTTPEGARLGEQVLLGPQNIARIISLPEPDIALVQMDVIPADCGAMITSAKNLDEHYTYVDMTQLYWDIGGNYWRPRGTVGDRITIRDRDNEQWNADTKSAGGAIPDGVSHAKTPANSPPDTPTGPRGTTTIVTSPRNLLHDTSTDKAREIPRAVSVQLKERLNLKLELKEDGKDVPAAASEDALSVTSRSPTPRSRQRDQGTNTTSEEVELPLPPGLYDTVTHALGSVHGRTQPMKSNKAGSHRSNTPNFALRSRRSSLESAEEAELQYIAVDSRPTTAHSERSVPSDVATAGTPVPAIEIPQVTQETGEQQTGAETKEGQNSQGVQTDTQEAGSSRANSAHVSGRPRKQSAKRLPYFGKGPRPMTAIDTYKALNVQNNTIGYHLSAYQIQRTEAWKRTHSPSSLSGRQTTPPPQRPSSPTNKEEPAVTKKVLNVKRGDNWLAGGRDVYWERLCSRPKSGHIPGWKEGLAARPKSAAATRAMRRAKTPTLVTPSSLAYDQSYGRLLYQSLPDIPHPTETYTYSPVPHQHGFRRLGTTPSPQGSRSNSPELLHDSIFSVPMSPAPSRCDSAMSMHSVSPMPLPSDWDSKSDRDIPYQVEFSAEQHGSDIEDDQTERSVVGEADLQRYLQEAEEEMPEARPHITWTPTEEIT